jgi:hypothetical protein
VKDLTNRDAVYKVVKVALDQLAKDRARSFWTKHWEGAGWSFEERRWTRQRSIEEIVRKLERIATDDLVYRGDPYFLFEWFLHPDCPAKFRKALSLKTWALIRDCAHGISPYLKRSRGRPRQSEAERRARNPIHDAVDLVPTIKGILVVRFPADTPEEINDAAEYCVERHFGLKSGAVADHLRRPKRRQLPRR